MSAFLIRRLLRFAVVCVGVSIVTFAILHASGDPVSLITFSNLFDHPLIVSLPFPQLHGQSSSV